MNNKKSFLRLFPYPCTRAILVVPEQVLHQRCLDHVPGMPSFHESRFRVGIELVAPRDDRVLDHARDVDVIPCRDGTNPLEKGIANTYRDPRFFHEMSPVIARARPF